jgi:hypothetical protein
LTNSASQPIPLDPVPQYLIGLEDKFSDGSEASAFGMFAGPQGQPFVVPANGSLTVSLPPQPFFEPEAFPPNGLLRVTFRFAGVPSGLATTTIHCNDVTTRLGAPRCAGRVAGPGDL